MNPRNLEACKNNDIATYSVATTKLQLEYCIAFEKKKKKTSNRFPNHDGCVMRRNYSISVVERVVVCLALEKKIAFLFRRTKRKTRKKKQKAMKFFQRRNFDLRKTRRVCS